MTQNAMAQRASQAYRGAAVTIAPLKAVILLLNGASTYLQKALQAQEEGRFEEGHQHLTRATAILRGLSHHLDVTRGGGVAERLFQTYNSLIIAALRSYGRPHMRENVQRLVASIAELREAWETVDRVSSAASRSRSGQVA